MSRHLIKEKNFAIQIAREAGALVLNNQGRGHEFEWTTLTNFRTRIDKDSDALIRQAIIRNFPQHNIISEEDAPRDVGSTFTWVADSLDGTLPWAFGLNDWFAVCIALVRHKDPILGVVFAPKRNELYVGVYGQGAYLNDQPISVSKETNINHVLLGVDPGKINRIASLSYIEKLRGPDGITCDFSGGCASVPLSFVAAGRLHGYLATSLDPWDMAAAVAVVRAGGGKATNLAGKEWNLDDSSILAANPILHGNIFNFLKTH